MRLFSVKKRPPCISPNFWGGPKGGVVGFSVLCCLLPLSAVVGQDVEKFEVHELAVWLLDPTVEQANARDRYPSAMPGVVSSIRSRQGARDKNAVSPLSMLTFYGAAVEDLEVSLRVQSGRFLASWPKSQQKSRRLRWLDIDLKQERAEHSRLAYVGAEHWFNRARKMEKLLVVQSGARTEQFLAYDMELKFSIPFRLEGGPDRYQVVNTSRFPLYDVLISVPTDEGRRIGWCDTVPASPEAVRKHASASTNKPELKPVRLEENAEEVWFVTFSPDGKILASGGADKTVTLWDPATGKKTKAIEIGTLVTSAAFAGDNRTLIAGLANGDVKLLDTLAGSEIATIQAHTSIVRSVVVSADGKKFATSSRDKTAKLWDIASRSQLMAVPEQPLPVYCVAISPDGKKLATGTGEWRKKARGEAKLWDVDSGKELAMLKGHDREIWSVVFSPDGKTLVTGSGDSTIKLWNVDTGEERGTLSSEVGIRPLAFAPKGNILAAGDENGLVKLWDTSAQETLGELKIHDKFLFSVAFSPDGKSLATSSGDKTVKLWKLPQDMLQPKNKIVGTVVAVDLSQPLPPNSAEFKSQTSDALNKRLLATGLTQSEVDLILSLYSRAIFKSNELVVLLRFPRSAVDEVLPLDLFPEPVKSLRTTLALVRNIDPGLRREVDVLVAQLGDADYSKREAAEKRLAKLGAIAIPLLKKALKHQDLEVVFRAERLLLGHGQSIDGK